MLGESLLPAQKLWVRSQSLRAQGPPNSPLRGTSPAFGQVPWAGDTLTCANPHHALAVIYACQILLKLLPNLEVHDVVPKSAQRADDHMVAVLHDLFVWLEQVGDFAQGHIDICIGAGQRRVES